MTDEEIIAMAQDAGWGFNNSRDSDFVKAQLRFARNVAKYCARKCEQYGRKKEAQYKELGESYDCGAASGARRCAAILRSM